MPCTVPMRMSERGARPSIDANLVHMGGISRREGMRYLVWCAECQSSPALGLPWHGRARDVTSTYGRKRREAREAKSRSTRDDGSALSLVLRYPPRRSSTVPQPHAPRVSPHPSRACRGSGGQKRRAEARDASTSTLVLCCPLLPSSTSPAAPSSSPSLPAPPELNGDEPGGSSRTHRTAAQAGA